jgi:hypothetical protein
MSAAGGGMLITTLSDAVPPGPEQLMAYVTDAFSPGVVRPADDVPVQPLGLTVQLVTLLDVQLIVTFVFTGTVIGPSDPLARMSTVGTGAGGVTCTVTLSVAFPPAPLQLIV